MDNESTPIESVQIDEIEKTHQSEAEAALAELSGGQSEPVQMPHNSMTQIHREPIIHHTQITEEDTSMDVEQDSLTDTLLSLLLTALVVAVAVFIFFSPKVRVLLEPFIGTGYVALAIRAIAIGAVSIVPSLVFL